MRVATVNGVPLAYQDLGERSGGPALLLLHGFPLSSDSFAPQLDALSKKYRVIAPDHRGFGATPPDPDGRPLEMAQIARDALGLLDFLKIDRAVVGGVSMGGYAAMALLREDAGRVAGLILVDTQPTADDEAGKRGREETAQAIEANGSAVLVERMLPKLISRHAAAAVRVEVERQIRATSQQGAAAASRGMALRTDSKDVLARYAGPALVVAGSEDPITPPAKAKAMAELIAGARFEELSGAGHLSNLESPAAFNRLTEAFLASVTGG